MIFLFFGGQGEKGKGFRVANVNWGFEGSASYQQVTSKLEGLDWGDKSGIRRFYRRVWKNIFYERRDKERKRGLLGMVGNFGLRRRWDNIYYL